MARRVSIFEWVSGACVTVIVFSLIMHLFRSTFPVRDQFEAPPGSQGTTFEALPVRPGSRLSFVPEHGSADEAFAGGIARSKAGLYSPEGVYLGQEVTQAAGEKTFKGEWIQARAPGGANTLALMSSGADLFKEVALLGSETGDNFYLVNVRELPPTPNAMHVLTLERRWPYYRLVVMSTYPQSDAFVNQTTAFFNKMTFEHRPQAERPEQAAQPVQAMMRPARSMAQPVQAMAQPVQAMVQPVQAMAQPVQAMVQPVQAMVQPVQAMAQPMRDAPRRDDVAIKTSIAAIEGQLATMKAQLAR